MATLIQKYDTDTNKELLGKIQTSDTADFFFDDVFVAGENINLNEFLDIGTDGKVYKSDSSDKNKVGRCIGIALQSVVENDFIKVRKAGKVIHTGWNLSPATNYFLTTNGNISNVPPTSGFIQLIGTSSNSDTMFIKIQLPILIGE